jgi:hypothetical protein
MKKSDYEEPFSFNDQEVAALKAFECEHSGQSELFGDLSGAIFSYTVVPSCLDTAKEVRCGCGDTLTPNLITEAEGSDEATYQVWFEALDAVVGSKMSQRKEATNE